jgi:prepilin-type N-terminal cleavage/methylation domain-containing protein
MRKGWASPRAAGFTIVELIIVIVVIAILATVVIVAYNGVTKSAAVRSVQNDLVNAAADMEQAAQANAGAYPSALPSTIQTSAGVSLTLQVNTLPHYSSLTAVQNGVLLSQICQDLVNAGLGSGLNQGGGTDAYITGCGNWNAGSMQVTGWTSQVFNTPIYDNTFTDYANAIPAGDSYHPNQQSVTQNFYRQLHSREIAEGGSFPITTFWDSWASPSNGGVMYQALPTADSSSSKYCINGSSTKYPDVQWHIGDDQKVVSGSC